MNIVRRPLVWSIAILSILLAPARLASYARVSSVPFHSLAQTSSAEREVAATFAPIFYQALGDKPRSDFLTNFDFDGDWRGDNNWDHAEDQRFPLRAYIYYSVAETATHFFIHYAVFHPRDYKGGTRKGKILSEIIREGARRGGKYDPTGLAEEATLAHENDMEGCLVVVAKRGDKLESARVVFVETLHHNLFSKYLASEETPKGFDSVNLDGQRVLLYIEPKGHGIEAYDGGDKQTAKKQFVIYRFAGKAEDPEKREGDYVGYELVPIKTTLWPKARIAAPGQIPATYAETHKYGALVINVVQSNGRSAQRKIQLGEVGSSFLGRVGGQNMARPPWGWFDRNDRDEPLGLWFFDPATIVKRDFKLDDSFSNAYTRLPFWATTTSKQ